MAAASKVEQKYFHNFSSAFSETLPEAHISCCSVCEHLGRKPCLLDREPFFVAPSLLQQPLLWQLLSFAFVRLLCLVVHVQSNKWFMVKKALKNPKYYRHNVFFCHLYQFIKNFLQIRLAGHFLLKSFPFFALGLFELCAIINHLAILPKCFDEIKMAKAQKQHKWIFASSIVSGILNINWIWHIK